MTDDIARIVVGVDGSPASKEALRWAARQAVLTQANLDVVIAWRPPVTYGYAVEISDADFEGRARETLDSLVSEVLGPNVPTTVRTSVTEGHPAPALIEAARGADLLVVGSRGHGAFSGMLLGSTSMHCVHHATCPVLVVRPSVPA
jgi:nucleotide-binding universal stress UspA family protein